MRRHPEVADITGNLLILAFTLSHLLWLREQEPAAFERIDALAVPKDHVRARLGAGFATERSVLGPGARTLTGPHMVSSMR